MIAVTGTPHSGTKFMAHLLQALGKDVQHESLGKEGISAFSWALADPSPGWANGAKPPGDLKENPAWLVIHVIRNPRLVVPALMQSNQIFRLLAKENPEEHQSNYEYLQRVFSTFSWDQPVWLPEVEYQAACDMYWAYSLGANQLADVTLQIDEAAEKLPRLLQLDPGNIEELPVNSQVPGERGTIEVPSLLLERWEYLQEKAI